MNDFNRSRQLFVADSEQQPSAHSQIGLSRTSHNLVPEFGPTSLASLPPLVRDPNDYIRDQSQNLNQWPPASLQELNFHSSSLSVGQRYYSCPEFSWSTMTGDITPTAWSTTQIMSEMRSNYLPGPEIYSRKVFVGGLPIDIKEEDIMETFRRFGRLVVDWPRKPHNKAFFPPKGYVFLVFEHESAVKSLLSQCFQEEESYFVCLSSPTLRQKAAHVRPWRLTDCQYYPDKSLQITHRLTVYLVGIPRPMTAKELGEIMDNIFGGVSYVGLDMDPFLKYPKCQGRVAFKSKNHYIGAISCKFVQLKLREMDKRAEIKPYIVDDECCERCGRGAPYFCGEVSCLEYLCQGCWSEAHLYPGYQDHKVMVKENWDRRPSTFTLSSLSL